MDKKIHQLWFIPENKEERDQILQKVRQYLSEKKLFPPLSLKELESQTNIFLSQTSLPEAYKNWIIVLINNELWRDTISSIPYRRRIFFLPQCMRANQCKGEFDEMGLLCAECGHCVMGEIQAKAEELGYAVLIAEGTTFVTSFLTKGKCDAVIGVSCLETLQRAFPYMVSQATPGIAIPLYKDGCKDTKADIDWVWDALYLKKSQEKEAISLDKIQKELNSWFLLDGLINLLGRPSREAEKIALAWLSKSGKRWRPLLSIAVFHTLSYKKEYPTFLKKIAIAVECFHKASLIHDDIEDEEEYRYEEIALHKQYGIPIALNVGDYLIGLGYKLLSSCGLEPEKILRMFQVASQSHLALCLGQGEELSWRKKNLPLPVLEVISIFQEKTAPAFSVALILGALAANAGENICQVLEKYSESLGIAYQIQDDIHDFVQEKKHLSLYRPSLFLSIAWEKASEESKSLLLSPESWSENEEKIQEILGNKEIEKMAKNLKEEYIEKAYQSLCSLENIELKQLLYRVLGKIIMN